MTDHPITRMRHEIVRRRLAVREVEKLNPNMLRITLQGGELAGFTSASPDDHIKLFVPGTDAEIERRDYTPRRYGRRHTGDRFRAARWRPGNALGNAGESRRRR